MSVPPSLHRDPAPSSPFLHTHPSLPSALGQKRLTQLLNHTQHQALLTACWLNGGKRSFLVVPLYILVCRLCQISSKGSDSILLLPPQKPAVAPCCLPHEAYTTSPPALSFLPLPIPVRPTSSWSPHPTLLSATMHLPPKYQLPSFSPQTILPLLQGLPQDQSSQFSLIPTLYPSPELCLL